MTQTFATVAQNILSDATQKNMTAKEISMQLVKNSPKRQSLIKEFLILSNKTAPVGTAALLIEAGNLIIDQCNLNNVDLTNLLSYPTNNLPSRYRSQKFYNLATGAPAAFLACLMYAMNSESGFLKNVGDAGRQFLGWVKEQGKAAGDTAKEIGLAPARGAFLLLLALNFRNLAARITNYDKQFPSDQTSSALKTKWENLGGDWAPLITTARNNANKKPLFGEPKNFIGPYSNVTGEPISTGTIITAGAAVITALTPILALANGDKKLSEVLPELTGDNLTAQEKEAARKLLEAYENRNKPRGGTTGGGTTGGGTTGGGTTGGGGQVLQGENKSNKNLYILLAAVAIGVIGYFYYSKKK
jgi:uncharacterized membrane protein YgcG